MSSHRSPAMGSPSMRPTSPKVSTDDGQHMTPQVSLVHVGHRRSFPALSRSTVPDSLVFSPGARQQGKMAQAPPSPPLQHRSPVAARSMQQLLLPEGVRSPQGPPKDIRATISFSGGCSASAPPREATAPAHQCSVSRAEFASPERLFAFRHPGQTSPPRASSPNELSPQVPLQLPVGHFHQAPPALQPFPAQLQPRTQVSQIQSRRYVPQAPNKAAVPMHVEETMRPKPSRSPEVRSPMRENFIVQVPERDGGCQEVRERSLEEVLQTLRQEVREQCHAQAEAIRGEVVALCAESRHRMQEAVLKMQDARGSDSSQVRMMMQSLEAQVQDCRQAVADISRTQDRPISSRTGLGLADLEVFKTELEAERICRSERIGELYDRIHREVGGVLKVLEEHRVAAVEALQRESDMRCKELEEVRATLDSVWSKASGSDNAAGKRGGYYLNYIDPPKDGVKDFGGDPDDVNTLYDMVREALGDTVHLRQLVSEERDHRARDRHQMDSMAREINTIRALLREATAGGKGGSRPTAENERGVS